MGGVKTNGAHWIRAALQVNPYGYHGSNAPSSKFPNEAGYNAALIAELRANDVAMIAITDHWCVETSAGLIKDATAAGLVALPGFEANSSEGIHLLVIFEAETDFAEINAAIGACGVTPSCANGTTGASYEDILRGMTKRGALVIPAHANVPNSGMLTNRTGPPLVQKILNPSLHAIGISPDAEDTLDQDKVLKGKAPYVRPHPISTIYADDVSHPNTIKSKGATTWFKVSGLKLESLKIAVRTPATRISLKNPIALPRALIREVSWTGGFLDGVTIPFADDLTALIGGRGTGKSTAIESLRYALGIEAIGTDAKRDHDGVVSKVLQSGTAIRVVVDAVSPMPARFTIERLIPNPPIVKDSSGTVTKLRPVDIVGPVEIFGQHELAELAQNKTSVAHMIKRFAGHEDTDQEADDIERRLKDNREKIARVEDDSVRLEGQLADIPRLEEQAAHYKATDLPARLKEQEQLGKDEAVFTEGADRVAVTQQVLDMLKEADIAKRLQGKIEDIDKSPQSISLKRVVAAMSKLNSEVQKIEAQFTTAVEQAMSEIEAAKGEWLAATNPQREAHAAVFRQLIKEGHKPDEYLATMAALEGLRLKSQRREGIATQLKALQTERSDLLGQLIDNEIKRAKQLSESIRVANKATGHTVIVRPTASPDREHIKSIFLTHIKNQRTQIMLAVEKEDFSPRAFVAAARLGVVELESQYGIRGAQASGIISAGEPLFRELEETNVGQAVDVLLDTSSSNSETEYRSLEDLSKGQRATALLLLLLVASNSPLIIDQPEDDLDNRFVYDGIVKRLRRLKGKRQIIVSTHNANVPVLGDAELIVALEGNGLRGWPMTNGIGSLDDGAVRKLAEQLLEGGRTAFDARQHLYGF